MLGLSKRAGGFLNFNSGGGGGKDYSDEINSINADISSIDEKLTNNFGYSYSEKVVGSWVDGRKIYKRTFDAGTSGSAEITITIDSNIDLIPKVELVATKRNNQVQGYSFYNSSVYVGYFRESATSFRMIRSTTNFGDSHVYVTLYYTKVSDNIIS